MIPTTAYRTLCNIVFMQKSGVRMFGFRPHSNPARGVYFAFPLRTDPRFREIKAEAWLERYRRAEAEGDTRLCEYGHRDCSTRAHGRCLDQTLTEFPHLSDV